MSAYPQIVGVVNATPDSFSDGGAYDPVAQAQHLIEQGANIIDVGAESTRPGATTVDAAEEWERLEPVLAFLQNQPIGISVDTRHGETVEKALAYKVQWINDVAGFADPHMVRAVASAECMLVVMHSITVPADPTKTISEETDVLDYLSQWAVESLDRLEAAGIDEERIILDPGIGFGTMPAQAVRIISHMGELVKLHPHWLVGHSRKSFMSLFSDAAAQERDALTRAFSAVLAEQGVSYVRVHDVAGHSAMWSK